MKNLILIACFILSLSISLLAQSPDTLWTKTFGGSSNDVGYSVQQTTDGGYIITGYTESFGTGPFDIWLIKTNSDGDTLWTKTFGGIGEDVGLSVQQTTDGGYIITGSTLSLGPPPSYDAWLIKSNSNGDTLWTKTFGGAGGEEGSSIAQTTDGGYVITGSTGSFGAGHLDVWLIKTDANGDSLWTKTFGGSDEDHGASAQQTSDGGYIITGHTYSFGAGGADLWLLKTDANGDTLWTKTFGGSDFDRGNSVQQTSDGGYIITGLTYSFGAGGPDVWLIKTDSNGDSLWTKTFGGSFWDEGNSVQQTTDGGYIISGIINLFDAWLIRTNANGDTLWTKTLGGNGLDEGNSIQQTGDGGYIIAGETSSFGTGGSDVWLIKVASDITGIDEKPKTVIHNFRLRQNYPNPFNPTTIIQYAIASRQFVCLKVYDILGKQIAAVVNEEKPAGTYTVEFDASELSSGIYFYQLQAGDFIETKKMILMR